MKKSCLLILLFTAVCSGSFSQEITGKQNNFSFSADYMFDNPFVFLQKNSSPKWHTHQLFVASTYKNKYRLRVSYAFPAVLLNKTYGKFYRDDKYIGIGFEFILNKRNRKFAFSLGPEYIYGTSHVFFYKNLHAVTGILKFSYRFNKNISVIFEPFNVGLGYVSQDNGHYLNSRYPWFPFINRQLSLGISINLY